MWWPRIDKDIEESVDCYTECQMFQSVLPVVPLQPWTWPTCPWFKLHLDFAGPMFGKMFLILIDANLNGLRYSQ